MGIDARTPVPTASGWKPAKLLKAGDTVYTYDGKPAKVSFVQLYTPLECHKAWLIGGLTLVADARTKLPVMCKNRIILFNEYWSRKKSQIKPLVIKPTSIDQVGEKSYLLNAKPLQFPERDLPVDPFELGRWIFSLGRRKRESRTDITRNLIERYPTIPRYIPDEYMFASFQQRLALLRGLLVDRKSVYHPRSHMLRYGSTDMRVTRQVQNLVESLGMGSTWRPDSSKSIKFKTFLRLIESQPNKNRSIHTEFRQIRKIEPTHPRECAYIKVEAPENTIVVGEGYICVTL
jgi:replicative DNA helicase